MVIGGERTRALRMWVLLTGKRPRPPSPTRHYGFAYGRRGWSRVRESRLGPRLGSVPDRRFQFSSPSYLCPDLRSSAGPAYSRMIRRRWRWSYWNGDARLSGIPAGCERAQVPAPWEAGPSLWVDRGSL